MTIAIIVAMNKELALLLPQLEERTQQTIDGTVFHLGRMGTNQVVAMQCGIGKVNAAIGALTLINHFAPELVINTGVAGGASKQVHVMDLVVGARVAYHDVWCGPESVYGAVNGLPLYYEAPQRVLDMIPRRHDILVGLICSGDQFIDTLEAVQRIQGHFPDALAVDMESGAIAQVCHLRGVPFLSMRVISDSPGASSDNTAQYNDFWQEAPAHTFALLSDILAKL
ncbi:MAG: 5'-methylthioadenosine/adenosylhomocysteine nucleosidase [Muribaculaceae bacterium]|nr:5'-methylthioadenosine/adenosylhomocysteine nucleosidase [Muribaculaceae bacterium]